MTGGTRLPTCAARRPPRRAAGPPPHRAASAPGAAARSPGRSARRGSGPAWRRRSERPGCCSRRGAPSPGGAPCRRAPRRAPAPSGRRPAVYVDRLVEAVTAARSGAGEAGEIAARPPGARTSPRAPSRRGRSPRPRRARASIQARHAEVRVLVGELQVAGVKRRLRDPQGTPRSRRTGSGGARSGGRSGRAGCGPENAAPGPASGTRTSSPTRR